MLHCENFGNNAILEVFHPETYLNKIIIGFKNGEIIIFNIKSKNVVHKFVEYAGETLTSLSGSPDPDIIALGFLNGRVTFFELRKGHNLFSLKVDGAVSSIAFRTDELAHLAVGSSKGDVQIFDLDSQKLEQIIPMHSKCVASLFFVPQQPLLISSSGDNSIVAYLFESSEYRCLRQRSGHYKPPTSIKFYGETSRFLVSAGYDRSVRFSSIFKDNQNFEFSQGSVKKIASKLKTSEEYVKLSEATGIDIFETKTLKWDNMLTSHRGESFAKTWRFDRKTIGQHSLESSDRSIISHISISSCGNFAILSTVSGTIDVYNLQSGIKRKTIKAFADVGIVASFTDSTNTQIISVSVNGTIQTFDFSKGCLLNALELDCFASNVCINKDTELIAIACSDNSIRVVDFSAMRLVRLFTGHTAGIKDLIFSSDSKWLVSCSQDKSIRTWDMASGNLADLLEVKNVPTALALSRNLEFLASCHEDEISISIWSNRSLYTGDCNIIESAINWSQISTINDLNSCHEVQYSEFPSSRWKNIYFLEKVRSNTRPTEMSSNKRGTLPFFLTQVLGQDKISVESVIENAPESISVSSEEFSESMEQFCYSSDASGCFNFLKHLHPSKLDFEISCLAPETKLEKISFILKSLNLSINSGLDFEIAHAVLALILRHHEAFICENRETFREIVLKLSESIQSKWKPLEDLMQSSICLISFAREQ